LLRGDSHALYRLLRRMYPDPAPDKPLPRLNHVREIHSYYASLCPDDRLLLLAWAKKEESGIGLIPAALSGVPLLGLIFAPFLQQTVRHLAPYAWLFLWFVGACLFITGIYIHHRQKAYTTLHIALLEQLCKEP
jgi:hypothetical protein